MADNVLVEVEGSHITAVTAGQSSSSAIALAGLTIPGFANCHSHAFHRALRGRTQRGRGDFWTWRQSMYDVAARLNPDMYYGLAYATYQEIFSGARWETLAAKGATPQRCLWASTSTKNPEYRDVIYVEELVGPDTVNTMPRATVEAVLDHGEIEETLTRDVEGARKVLDDLKAAGIDYDDVVDTLEKEGVQKFADSFKDLFSDIESKRDQLVAA